MSNAVYLSWKSLANIFRRPLSLIASFLSLLLLFLMLNLDWVTYLTAEYYFDSRLADVNMEIFIDDSLGEEEVTDIIATVSRQEGVDFILYVTKEEAREKLFSLMGTDLLEGLDANPLPRSLIIEFQSDFLSNQNLGALVEDLARLPGVTEVYYPQHWLEKIEDSRSLLFKMVLFLGIIVSLAIVLNLLHTTRLSIRSYYEELRQLRLLGADKTFLYFPYLFEGLFYALISSIAGWLIVFFLAGNLTFQNIVTNLPERMEIIIFCAAAGLIGVIVGYIGIRRVIR